jgi:hypothetical protein
MISANDVLHIISETHQFSTVLLELKDTTVIGISQDPDGKLSYFKCSGTLTAAERSLLAQQLYNGHMPSTAHPLPVEELLREIEGKRAKHIWLESTGKERTELGFLSISELKAHFRSHPQR